MKIRVFIFLSLVILFNRGYAQLRFPAGTILNLNTHSEFLYSETGIYFKTGANKVSDYIWTRNLADSLDTRWDFQACMNGDCKVGLPYQGPFILDFGDNDTTGYIKVHISTGGFTGSSKLLYEVAHKSDTADKAMLTFNIHYTNNTSNVEIDKGLAISAYPNPVTDILFLHNRENESVSARLIQLNGAVVVQKTIHANEIGKIETGELKTGLYLLDLEFQNHITHKKIQVIKP